MFPLLSFIRSSSILLSTSLAVIPDASLNLFIYERILSSFSPKHLKSKFHDKRVWITGASSGLGEEIAKQLHGHGAKLILSGRREGELERISQELSGDGGTTSTSTHVENRRSHVQILPFEITGKDEKEVSRIVTDAIGRYNGIDILILNAGIGQLSPATEESMKTTKQLMDVNFHGPVQIAMEVIKQDQWGQLTAINTDSPHIMKHGHIVYTSSVASKLPIPLGTSYAASKHAAHGYFSSLRSECQPWLRIDLPCPGPIGTKFQTKALNKYNNSKQTSLSSSNIGSEDNDSASEVAITADRCARLIVTGICGPKILMQETWISKQPTLLFMYLNQYLPIFTNWILGIVGSLRLKAFKAGLPLYKVSSWIKVMKSKNEG